MENKEKIKFLKKAEEKYYQNEYDGNPTEANINFKLIPGKLPILLSAPHAVNQTRDGKIKFADKMTGSMVELLCKETGAYGIIRTYNMQDDPSADNTGHGLLYKKAILELMERKPIRCLIDLHGCRDNSAFDMDIGTNQGKNTQGNQELISWVRDQLAKAGRTGVDYFYTAERNTTVCNYVSSEKGIPCIQIELSATLRTDPDKLISLISALEEVITHVERQLESSQKRRIQAEVMKEDNKEIGD